MTGLQTSETARRKALPEAWTPKLVGDELIEAVRWANATAGPVGPARLKSSLPDPVFSLHDRIAEDWDWVLPPDLERRSRRLRSPVRIGQLERTLWWATRYLSDLPGPAGVLKVWVRCKVYRRPFDDAAKYRGWSRATAYRARDKALAAIAVGLERDGFPVR